ncbi:MAG: HAMP domain-containing histidine kinase [Oscillospiraceae bacterium]|jgi:signal transduction histidine kinase|nr:HAMP domain-containing histidine kinase [Oscillospiraceae bacterium]
MLVLLNTYPVWISQNVIFSHIQTTMRARASLITSALSDADTVTAESVRRVMDSLRDQPQYRTVVCDHTGLAVYDSLSAGAVEGRYTLIPELAEALRSHDVFRSVYRDAAFDSRYAMPVFSRGEVAGALYLGQYDAPQGLILAGLQSNMLMASVIIFFAVLLFSLFVSMALSRRISGILRGIRAAHGGDYGYTLSVRGRDELTEVSGQLNRLFALLQKTEGLRQQFVSNASHELRTPLAAVRLLADSILGTPDMPVETIREFVADIGEETDRLSRMTEKLMLLSRLDTQPAAAAVTDTAPVIWRAARMLEPLARDAGVTIRCELSERCLISGSEDELYQVLFNLMDNAVKYNKRGGDVRVLSFCRGNETHIVVSDTGSGIPKEDLPFIFDRFYRVDKARSRAAGGAGLGLSIVAQTVARIGGSVKAESTPGEGSRFTLIFPLAKGADRHE